MNVTLYYESLCPHSRVFITDQLKPNYETFKDYIKVELVPYGKAKVCTAFLLLSSNWLVDGISDLKFCLLYFYQTTVVDDGISFKCQHGKSECAGNGY